MLTAEENSMLCRVGPGTQMGAMMRRYWLPLLLSSDLEPNGDPKRVRLLGEDLVAFRDSEGRVGLLDELCPHRRASLALGRNENGYIECLYHGWRIDCGGRIIDTPVEPEGSTFKNRVRATAYQTCEAGGVIWAYLGPPERTPSAPAFHFTQVAPERRPDSSFAQLGELGTGRRGRHRLIALELLAQERDPAEQRRGHDDSFG